MEIWDAKGCPLEASDKGEIWLWMGGWCTRAVPFLMSINFLLIKKRRKHIWILDWCYMCKCNGESIDGYIWMATLHCMMWCLWRERNNWCFEDIEGTMTELKLCFFRTMLDWMSILRSQSLCSVSDLIDWHNFCDWLIDWVMSLVVYFLYTWVTILILINSYYLSTQKKKN